MNDARPGILMWGIGSGPENESYEETNFCSSKKHKLCGAAQKRKALPQEVGTPCHESVQAGSVNAQGWESLKAFQHWMGELD